MAVSGQPFIKVDSPNPCAMSRRTPASQGVGDDLAHRRRKNVHEVSRTIDILRIGLRELQPSLVKQHRRGNRKGLSTPPKLRSSDSLQVGIDDGKQPLPRIYVALRSLLN
jgi:hypothetical protein